MYVPAATVAATLTAPVAGSSVMPAGHVPLAATVALPPAPSVAGAPLMLSFAAILATAVLAAPTVTAPVSGCATTLETVTVTCAVVQCGGVNRSHNW